jgi:ubiquinone biosynthesis protein UbiJ
MLGNVISAQVVRYVTERVIENLARQANRQLDGAAQPGVTDLAIAAQFHGRLDAFAARLDELNRQLSHLSDRVATTERRTGWAYTMRLTFGILFGIVVGFATATVVHLAGWTG